MTKGNLSQLGSGKTEYKYDNPDWRALESFENPKPNIPFLVHLTIPEFTSLCPKTGQPDFACIEINYVPNKYCVESKALKLYMFSYRQFGEFHEACVNRIADDLFKAIAPLYIEVKGLFYPRGGISLHPTAFRYSAEGAKLEQDSKVITHVLLTGRK